VHLIRQRFSDAGIGAKKEAGGANVIGHDSLRIKLPTKYQEIAI
jgi:hypothetical protein